MTPTKRPYLSVVAPFLNEEDVLSLFCAELRKVLDLMNGDYEVLLVDDGSTDDSIEVLRSLEWAQCRVVRLVQNAGHQSALNAGLMEARGSWVVTMDTDLQHPPECIPAMLEMADQEDLDIVYAVRVDREDDGFFKRFTAETFYLLASILARVSVVRNAADFRLISNRVVQVVNSVPGEKVFRLLLPSLGFPSGELSFKTNSRQAGVSKFSTGKMFALALSGALSFSASLLRLVSLLGIVMSFVALVWLLYVLISVAVGNTVSGWASVMSVLLVFSGVSLLAIGLVGEYLAQIFDLLKGKPTYVVDQVISLTDDESVEENREDAAL